MQKIAILSLLGLWVSSVYALPRANVVEKRNSATPTYTLTQGFTGIPTQSANPAGCTTVDFSTAGDTRNDIVSKISCKNLTLLFSRGTFEAGNIGSIVGPPMVTALVQRLGSAQVAVQGVNHYAADVAGFNAGGSDAGAQNMAGLIKSTIAQCPHTKLCVSGYSQGAQVVHKAVKLISAKEAAFVNSVVLYGDPDDGQAVGAVPAGKVSTDCHLGDDICLGGNLILPPHLDYCLDAGVEADFVVGKSGLVRV